jgi:hypothetical protein
MARLALGLRLLACGISRQGEEVERGTISRHSVSLKWKMESSLALAHLQPALRLFFFHQFFSSSSVPTRRAPSSSGEPQVQQQP